MSYNTKLTFNDILLGSQILKTLNTKANLLKNMDIVINRHLDQNLAKNCKVANIQGGILTMTVNTAVWAHQLRFSSLEILSVLRNTKEGIGIKSIKIKVVPDELSYAPEIKKEWVTTRNMSQKTASHLRLIAENIEYSILKSALIKLSKHGK